MVEGVANRERRLIVGIVVGMRRFGSLGDVDVL